MAHLYSVCSFCGKREDVMPYKRIQSPIVSLMRRKKLCFQCAYWQNWMVYPEDGAVFIDHTLYRLDAPLERPIRARLAKLKNPLLLFSPKTHELCVAPAYTRRGDLPSAFWKVLPDDFKSITKREYYILDDIGDYCCRSKGCFDRYHCIWYDQNIMEKDSESWNTVPETYIVGSEGCPSFINKYKLYDNI